jgi:hypothetical protein
MAEGLVSRHISAGGTLVRANTSYKSFLPIEAEVREALGYVINEGDQVEDDGATFQFTLPLPGA